MESAKDLPPAVRDTLTKLVQTSDREPPAVFAGRQDEFALLDNVVQGVQRGGLGRTVAIQGVPGAGKTALANEYAARLLAADGNAEHPVVPVLLDSSALDSSPASIVEDFKSFRLVLPSLATHFAELRQAHATADNKALRAVRAAANERQGDQHCGNMR